MVLKAKSEDSIKPLKDVSDFSSWSLPQLKGGKSPGFRQGKDEKLTDKERQKKLAEEVEKKKNEVREKGYNTGYQEGLKKAEQEVTEKVTLLSQLITQLGEPIEQCQEKTEKQLLQLSFAIARQIVRRELQQDPTQLIAIIRDAISLLPNAEKKIEISLHPEDAKIVKNALSIDKNPVDQKSIEQESTHQQTSTSDSHWNINDNLSIERGCCQVTTQDSKVDASIDKQIAVLFSKVVGGQRETDAGSTHVD